MVDHDDVVDTVLGNSFEEYLGIGNRSKPYQLPFRIVTNSGPVSRHHYRLRRNVRAEPKTRFDFQGHDLRDACPFSVGQICDIKIFASNSLVDHNTYGHQTNDYQTTRVPD